MPTRASLAGASGELSSFSPQLDLPMPACAAACGQLFAVRAECQASCVAETAVQRQHFLARVEVPKLHDMVGAGRGKTPVVGGMEGDGPDHTVVTGEGRQSAAVEDIPKDDRSVFASR